MGAQIPKYMEWYCALWTAGNHRLALHGDPQTVG